MMRVCRSAQVKRHHRGTIHPKHHSVGDQLCHDMQAPAKRCMLHIPAGLAAAAVLRHSRRKQQLTPCQNRPTVLQEAESDAAASQVQVATIQRQLTAARCASLLELRQQVLGAAGAGTSAPDMSSEEFRFRPSGAANEVWLLIAWTKLCMILISRGSSYTFQYGCRVTASPKSLALPPLLSRLAETGSCC